MTSKKLFATAMGPLVMLALSLPAMAQTNTESRSDSSTTTTSQDAPRRAETTQTTETKTKYKKHHHNVKKSETTTTTTEPRHDDEQRSTTTSTESHEQHDETHTQQIVNELLSQTMFAYGQSLRRSSDLWIRRRGFRSDLNQQACSQRHSVSRLLIRRHAPWLTACT